MLSRNVKNILSPATLQHLIEGVELFRLRQLCNVSRVNKEGRRRRHRVDSIEGGFEGRGHIFVRLFTEPDMTVANLQKAEIGSCRQRVSGLRDLGEGFRYEYAATDRPK